MWLNNLAVEVVFLPFHFIHLLNQHIILPYQHHPVHIFQITPLFPLTTQVVLFVLLQIIILWLSFSFASPFFPVIFQTLVLFYHYALFLVLSLQILDVEWHLFKLLVFPLAFPLNDVIVPQQFFNLFLHLGDVVLLRFLHFNQLALKVPTRFLQPFAFHLAWLQSFLNLNVLKVQFLDLNTLNMRPIDLSHWFIFISTSLRVMRKIITNFLNHITWEVLLACWRVFVLFSSQKRVLLLIL